MDWETCQIQVFPFHSASDHPKLMLDWTLGKVCGNVPERIRIASPGILSNRMGSLPPRGSRLEGSCDWILLLCCGSARCWACFRVRCSVCSNGELGKMTHISFQNERTVSDCTDVAMDSLPALWSRVQGTVGSRLWDIFLATGVLSIRQEVAWPEATLLLFRVRVFQFNRLLKTLNCFLDDPECAAKVGSHVIQTHSDPTRFYASPSPSLDWWRSKRPASTQDCWSSFVSLNLSKHALMVLLASVTSSRSFILPSVNLENLWSVTMNPCVPSGMCTVGQSEQLKNCVSKFELPRPRRSTVSPSLLKSFSLRCEFGMQFKLQSLHHTQR